MYRQHQRKAELIAVNPLPLTEKYFIDIFVFVGGVREWESSFKYAGWFAGKIVICRHVLTVSMPVILLEDAITWWRHQMGTFSALLALCAGNSSVPVNSPHKGQWRGALMFSLICARMNDWVNNREAGDLRRYRAHYDVIVVTRTVTILSKYSTTPLTNIYISGAANYLFIIGLSMDYTSGIYSLSARASC